MPHKSYLKLQLFAGFAVKQIQGSVKQMNINEPILQATSTKKQQTSTKKQIWDVAFGMKETFFVRIPVVFFPPHPKRSPKRKPITLDSFCVSRKVEAKECKDCSW